MRKFALAIAAAFLVLAGPVPAAFAAEGDAPAAPAPAAPNASQEARDAEAKAAWTAADAAAVKGPADVPFLTEATLKLPQGFAFVPIVQSNRLMRAWGNSAGGEGFLGMIFPSADENWFITIHYVDAGYVKDEEAKNWDTDALLQAAKDGVAADNADRRARGFQTLKVDGWIQKPAYDATQHHLVYAISLSDTDAKPGAETDVNFHTYALGRDGYFALDLVTGSSTVETYKDRAQTVLAALQYAPGKRYDEYVAGTDRVAEYGIAALVAGVAAKKLGLLALAALALTKFGGAVVAFAKPILAGAVALFAGAARLFRRKK